ncbi:hypothetical protein PYW08_011060 [Mythimna loreyi]|uniref:Uncharacterized protein n=1 Tax=Mythimna loreyi TaxID=667449 RepID=A0ACC2Q2H2_9NEOP|nr:hypothetical protein PYW08_011060 [Mythimna loreyi]
MVRCCVKGCKSDSVSKIPGLSFHSFPEHYNLRQSWIAATKRRDWAPKPSSKICSKHFNDKMLIKKKRLTLLLYNAVPSLLPKDMENYIQYSLMGSVGKIRMRPDCLPSKLEYPDGMKSEVAVVLGTATGNYYKNSEIESAIRNNIHLKNQATQVRPEATDQFIQVCLRAKIRSKAVQCTVPTKDQSTSLTNMYSATSPYTCRVKTPTFNDTKAKSKLLLSNGKLEETHMYSTVTSPSSQSLLVRTNSERESQCEFSEIQIKMEQEDVYPMSPEQNVLIKNNLQYYSPDAEQDLPTVKMEEQEDRPRVPIKVISGPSPKYKVNEPPDPSPAIMITEIKSEAREGSLSREGSPSCDEEPGQSDDNQPPEDLVPLSAHPVPLSDAPDPLCDVQVKREEEETGEDRTAVEECPLKDKDREKRQVPSDAIHAAETAMNNMFKTHRQEQKIKSLTQQRERLTAKMHAMRQMIRRRDSKLHAQYTELHALHAQLHALRSFVTQHHGHAVVQELTAVCGDADSQQIQCVKQNDRNKPNRVVLVVKGADRPKTSVVRHKTAQTTPHIRPTSAIQQQSLISVQDTSDILQKALLADKNTSNFERTLVVSEKTGCVKQILDKRKKPSLVIQPLTDIPKKPSAATNRSLTVVKAKSVRPQIGSKRKSDIRQDPSVFIHPKLDVGRKVASDSLQTTDGGMSDVGQRSSDVGQRSLDVGQRSSDVGQRSSDVRQRTSDVRQNALVIQIDGMHSTVLQPTLVRLDDNDMDLG